MTVLSQHLISTNFNYDGLDTPSSISLHNAQGKEFLEIGCFKGSNFIAVLPNHLYFHADLERIIKHALKKLNNKGAQVNPENTFAVYRRDEEPNTKSLTITSLEKAVKEIKSMPLRYTVKDKPAARARFLREVYASNPDVFPIEAAFLFQIEEQKDNSSSCIYKPIKRYGREFYTKSISNVNFDMQDEQPEISDYNPNSGWNTDNTIDNLLEKKRNNYEDFGPDQPSELMAIELDGYLEDYNDDDFCPARDRALLKHAQRFRRLEDFIDSTPLKLSEQNLPALLRKKDSEIKPD